MRGFLHRIPKLCNRAESHVGRFARAQEHMQTPNWSPPEYIAGVWHQPGWFSGAHFRAPEPVGEKESQILERSTS